MYWDTGHFSRVKECHTQMFHIDVQIVSGYDSKSPRKGTSSICSMPSCANWITNSLSFCECLKGFDEILEQEDFSGLFLVE